MFHRRSSLQTFVIVGAIGLIIGAGYAAFLDFFIHSKLSIASFLRGAFRGLAIAVIVLALESALYSSRLGVNLRKANFAQYLLLRTLATTAIFAIAITLSRVVIPGHEHHIGRWFQYGLPRDFTLAAVAAITINYVLQTRRLIGGRVLTYFLLGRYNRPVVEDRVFMLIDIVGSTAMAERLGDKRALELICELFFDLNEPIVRHDGEVHAYVGDEIVVSWQLSSPDENARCLKTAADIQATIVANEAKYMSKFGEAPSVRIGLQGGSVAVGECGDDKRQVVYIGDTINTAKRLQEICKEYRQRILMSQELLQQINLPAEMNAIEIDRIKLQGRSVETVLFTIEPIASAQ